VPAAGKTKSRRAPLTRDRVLRTAVAVADRDGIDAVTMRRLGQELGVEAMSLYHHVANRDAILDGMVDAVFAEIELPSPGTNWRDAISSRTESVREALLRHRWAIGLMDSRANAGDATLRHHDAVIATLRAGGFTVAGAAHAFSVIDSYVYGFVLQEVALPFQTPEELEEVAGAMLERMAGDYPHLAELATEHAMQPGYDYADEFGIGLDLVLDGLARRRRTWR
jgi:AcrR family transcriptional regulator